MPSIREVHSKFNALIDQQRKIINALKEEQTTLNTDIGAATLNVSKAVTEAIGTHDAASLSKFAQKLDSALTEAKMTETSNYTEFVTKNISNNAELDTQITDYIATYGSAKDLARARAEAEKKRDISKQLYDIHQETIKTLTHKAEDITTFNSQNPENAITADTRRFYEEKSVWRYITDKTYRTGRAALLAYKGDYFDDKSNLDTISTQIEDSRAGFAHDQAEYFSAAKKKQDLDDLISAKIDLSTIAETLSTKAQSALLISDQFAKALSNQIGPEFATTVYKELLRQKNLGKIRDNISEQISSAQKTLSQLEAPMSKLDKGKRNAPSKHISLDLDKISNGVNNGVVLSSYRLASAERARNAVNSYTPSAGSDIMSLQNLMLIWMISDMSVDPAYAHSTIGLDADVVAGLSNVDINLDLDHLTPDIAGAINGLDGVSLSDSFNDLDLTKLDISNIDVGNVDVGNLDVSVPNIDVSVPTFDLGGSGGFGGGGFD